MGSAGGLEVEKASIVRVEDEVGMERRLLAASPLPPPPHPATTTRAFNSALTYTLRVSESYTTHGKEHSVLRVAQCYRQLSVL